MKPLKTAPDMLPIIDGSAIKEFPLKYLTPFESEVIFRFGRNFTKIINHRGGLTAREIVELLAIKFISLRDVPRQQCELKLIGILHALKLEEQHDGCQTTSSPSDAALPEKKTLALLGWRIDWPTSNIGNMGAPRWCGLDDWQRKDRSVMQGGVAVELWGDPAKQPSSGPRKEMLVEVCAK